MSTPQRSRARSACFTAGVALLLPTSAARAVDHDWVNPAGGFFDQTTNWDPVAVPGAGDRGIFNLNGSYTVGFLFDRTAARLLVARDNVTFDLNSTDLVLNSAGTGAGSTSLVVGQAGPFGGSGRLTIGEGSISAQAGNIGTGASTLSIGGAGSVTVTTGGVLRFSNALNVGSTRAGNVIVTGGGRLLTANTTIGADAAGSVTVSGGTSSWATTSWIVVGGRAAGALSLNGGGLVTQGGAGAQGVVADQSTSTGVVNVDGAGSRWTVGAELYLGNLGDATVNVTNGGLLTATTADTIIANGASSASTVTVGGGDATLNTRSLALGAGAGTLNINPGGRVLAANSGSVSVSSTGRINLAGGLLQSGSLQLASPSRLNWTAGTLHLTTGTVIIGSSGVLGSNVAVGAGMVLRAPELHVAGGSLSVTGGGVVNDTTSRVGENFSANGTVLVSGPGSTWNVTGLSLGNFGNATLTIADGGAVVNNSANAIHVAGATISTSRVTVDGVGSTWDASTIPTAQGFVRIGYRGTGFLDITDGGRVTNDFTHAHVGSETGSNGSVTVDGAGSAWDIGYYLFVGGAGNGSLAVTGGGTVSAQAAAVGWAIGSHGSLSLAGAGSRLDVGSLNVGHNGGGTVTIGAGASLDATSAEMATEGIGTALVHVNGGTMRAGISTVMSPRARVQYDAGTFQTGALQMTGAARVTLAPGRNKIVETTGLSVDAAGGSRIDLADNFLVVDYMMASPIDDVKDLIVTGYSGGGWDGNGINSSTANTSSHGIGYAEASDVFTSFPATFAGRSVDDSTVLVAYARYGDANLDGLVNLSDFNRLAARFGQAGRWSDGDFTYDGIVNLSDFNRLAANFGLGAAGPDAPTPSDWSALASAVPEPNGAVAVTMFLAAVSRRRKRTLQVGS